MFTIGVLALATLAAVFVWLPSLRSRRSAPIDRERVLIEMYRSRRDELSVESADLPAESAEALAQELDAALLDDLKPVDEADPTARLRPLYVAAFAVFVVAVGAMTYWGVGDPTAPTLKNATVLLTEELSPSDLEEWQTVLSDRLAAMPDHAPTWYLQGHLHMQRENFQLAAEAFSTAHSIQGPDPSIDIYWLQARYLANEGRMDEQSVNLAERIIERDPNNASVLQLLGVAHFQTGEFDKAVGMLNRALGAARSMDMQMGLANLLKQVRTHMPAAQPAIDVAVRTRTKAPQGATVFVIARPVGGGMPFAVARRPSVLLPLEVRLDDLVSMNPALPLSSAAEIEVVVRLSQSGQAARQEGDWQWVSDPVDLQGEGAIPPLDVVLSPPENG